MYAIKWPIISPILFGFKYCNARIIQVLNHWFVVYLCFKAVLDTLKAPSPPLGNKFFGNV